MMECKYYRKIENYRVICDLCPRHCLIKENFRGYCRARYNVGGILYTENYFLSSLALDPIEKKPLFHFFPGSMVLSVGGSGCNFRCIFCQNWQISQCANNNHIEVTPDQLVEKAMEFVSSGNIGIAYTYSDPIVMTEYVLQSAALIKKNNLKNIFVSNGYIEEKPLMDLLNDIDAFNIDVKAFTKDSYQEKFAADFSIIQKNIELIVKKNKHLEISCLIVPGFNDKIDEAEKFFQWLAEIDQKIPVHINRYYPCYQANMPATDISLLMEIKKVAVNHLKFVYVGNI